MPNVTIFMPAANMPAAESLEKLTDQCAQLCIDVLHAAPQNVHIIYVPTQHGRGHLVFAEIHYRLETFRTPAVMADFMAQLDDLVQQHTGLVARIRCFGHAAAAIYARN